MPFALRNLHDATLTSVRFDRVGRVRVFEFAGTPTEAKPFAIMLFEVTEVSIPANWAWGQSESALEEHDLGARPYDLAMQSGDTIVVMSARVPGFRSADLQSLADIQPVGGV